jgi:2-methylcitrate dehydratase PrpD
MLKDGSGWGAMVGVSAGQLAYSGFTGAPALTVESSEISHLWNDLGTRWYLMEQDFKRHAVCHWAQPAIFGTLRLIQAHNIAPKDIAHIRVFSFHEATRLTCRRPKTTEEAQYSLPFPVAAAVILGDLGPNELSGKALSDRRILELAERINIFEDDTCNSKFPGKQMARVSIETISGKIFETEAVESPWDQSDLRQPEKPPDKLLLDKFHWLVSGRLPKSRSIELEQCIWQCDELDDVQVITNLMAGP